jgi:hemolysin activation/secretion protein
MHVWCGLALVLCVMVSHASAADGRAPNHTQSAMKMPNDTTVLIVTTDPQLPKLAVPLPKPSRNPAAHDTACFPVDKIYISGIALLNRDDVAYAIQPFRQSCQGNKSVEGLLLAINALYASKGYITTQAYLPKQDLKKTRKIAIEIKAGRIGEIVYDERPKWDEGTYFERLTKNFKVMFNADSVPAFFAHLDTFVETLDDPIERSLLGPSGRAATALVIQRGDVLNIENIQQGLDQLNRAASSKAQSKLDPGTEPNTSVVRISDTPDDTFRVIAGYDTYGSKSTGIARYRAEVFRDNLIGINDTWKASLTSSTRTNEATAALSIPYGWWTWSVDGKYSESLVLLSPFAELFSQTTTLGTSLTFTALRTPAGKLDVTGGLRTYTNNRFINDVELTPQLFTAIDLGVSRTFTLGKSGMLILGLKGSAGLFAFHATHDPEVQIQTTPRAQFRKVEGTLGLQWAATDTIVVTSNLTSQFSDTALYSPDQFTIGGLTSVRGFKAAPVLGDRGAHWRNEIGTKLPVDAMLRAAELNQAAWLAARLKAIEGYGFIDAGYVYDIANAKETRLVGAGVGVRIKDHRLTVDLSVARGLEQRGASAPLATEVYINAGWKLF